MAGHGAPCLPSAYRQVPCPRGLRDCKDPANVPGKQDGDNFPQREYRPGFAVSSQQCKVSVKVSVLSPTGDRVTGVQCPHVSPTSGRTRILTLESDTDMLSRRPVPVGLTSSLRTTERVAGKKDAKERGSSDEAGRSDRIATENCCREGQNPRREKATHRTGEMFANHASDKGLWSRNKSNSYNPTTKKVTWLKYGQRTRIEILQRSYTGGDKPMKRG